MLAPANIIESSRRRFLVMVSGLTVLPAVVSCNSALTVGSRNPDTSTSAESPAPTLDASFLEAEHGDGGAGNEILEANADTIKDSKGLHLETTAIVSPASYIPGDRESILMRYKEDRARIDEVLVTEVPVLWITEAIW